MNRAATEADLTAIDVLSEVDAELRHLLREVRLSVDTVCLSPADRADLIGSFRRFIVELLIPEAHPDRLMRYWKQIDELAPTVAHELAQLESVQRLSLRWGEGIKPKGGYLNERAARDFVESVTDPRVRHVLEWAYAEMLELSMFEGLRPAGGFDLLYFYRFLAKWFESPHLKVELPAADPSER